MCEVRFDNKPGEISTTCGAYLSADEVEELCALDAKFCPWCGDKLEIVWPLTGRTEDEKALERDYWEGVL